MHLIEIRRIGRYNKIQDVAVYVYHLKRRITMARWTEDALRERITEKTAKWEDKIQKMNQNWRLLFAYPVFLIVFMVGACINDYMPFFLTVTAVFIYFFVKNVLQCLISKERIRLRIVAGGLLVLMYAVYIYQFWK